MMCEREEIIDAYDRGFARGLAFEGNVNLNKIIDELKDNIINESAPDGTNEGMACYNSGLLRAIELVEGHIYANPKWINTEVANTDGTYTIYVECPMCGTQQIVSSKYCPECGVKLEEEQESEECAGQLDSIVINKRRQ